MSTTRVEAAPFSIGGGDEVLTVAADTPLRLFLVYPGIYTITGAFPEEILTPGENLTHTVVADYPGDASTAFAVTRLPSE